MEQYKIFLDTNIYIASNYSFTNKFFRRLCELIRDGDVILLSCTLVVGEVKEHIKSDIEIAVNEVNKALKSKAFTSFRYDEAYKQKVESIESQEWIEILNKKFHSFLEDNQVSYFSLDGISNEDIMKDYFAQNPPFETKKPDEFKDAIIIKAIKNYQKEINEEILIVSEDKGFKNAFLDDDKFKVFNNLSELLNWLSRTNEVLVAIKKYFENDFDSDEIQSNIEDFLLNATYEYDEMEEWEYNSIEINDIEYEPGYIETADDGSAVIYLDVLAKIEMTSKFLDQDNSYYDKEEDDYLVKGYLTANEEHRITHEVALRLKYFEEKEEKNEKPSYKIKLDRVDDGKTDYLINLSEDTLCDRTDEENFMDADNKKWYENHVIKCVECGRVLGFNDEGNYHNYDGEAICKDCAVTNENGFICPSCGLKVPYEKMGNSGCYCIDCEEENDL